MNNYFIKKFFPKLGGWIISTLILEVITLKCLPDDVKSFLLKLQASPLLSSFVVLLISFILYVIYISYKFASYYHRTYCKDVESIDKSLWDCYLKSVISDRIIIAKKFHDLQSDKGADLIWETSGLVLDDCKDDCPVWKNQHLRRFSKRLRERMIDISLAYLNWRVNACLAVETHLKDVVSDGKKFRADVNYRKDQLKEIKSRLKRLPVFNYFFKLDNRRIIVVSESDWKFLMNKHTSNLIKYLQWHINEKWNAILCLYKENIDKPSTFTLSSIFDFPRADYDEFSDFVIIKKIWDDNSVVFAQNSNGFARVVKETTNDNNYNKWFNSVWDSCSDNIDNNATYAFHNINQEFVNNINKNNTK